MGGRGGAKGGGGGSATGSPPTENGVSGMDAVTSAERRAVDDYTGTDYKQINRYLREGYVNPHGMTEAEMRDKIDKIAAAVGKGVVVKDGVLYRGTNLANLGLTGGPKVGQVVRDKAFSSTSRDAAIAFGRFAGNVQLTISTPRGTRAADASYLTGGHEREVLLARRTSLKVTAARTTTDANGSVVHHVAATVVRK